jgi:hypothetical protein
MKLVADMSTIVGLALDEAGRVISLKLEQLLVWVDVLCFCFARSTTLS